MTDYLEAVREYEKVRNGWEVPQDEADAAIAALEAEVERRGERANTWLDRYKEQKAEVERLKWMLREAWEAEFVLSAMPGESNYEQWKADLAARYEAEHDDAT